MFVQIFAFNLAFTWASIGMLTELNLLNPEGCGEMWKRCSPDRLCIADATGPCMVASAVFGPPICDATKGT